MARKPNTTTSKVRELKADAPEVAEHAAERVPLTLGSGATWLAGVFLAVFALASLVSYQPADPPGRNMVPVHEPGAVANWIGPVGARFAHEALLSLGIGAWVLLGGFLLVLGLRAAGYRVTQLPIRLLGLVLVGLAISATHAVLFPGASSFPEGGGGLVAIAAADALVARFNELGAMLWIVLALILGLLVTLDRWLVEGPRRAAVAVLATTPMFRGALAGVAERVHGVVPVRPNDLDDDARIPERPDRPARPPRSDQPAKPAKAKKAPVVEAEDDWDDAEAEDADEYEYEYEEEDAEAEDGYEYEYEEEDEDDDGGVNAPKVFSAEELREKIAKLPVRFAGASSKSASDDDLTALRARMKSEEEADRNYLFPPLDLLVEPEQNYNKELESYVREQAEALERALTTYGIKGEVVAIESGPVITLYQVSLAPGTKVASLNAVSSDIARALKAVNVRIVPNTEGLDTVGIEVPNRIKEKVRLRELMAMDEKTQKMRLPMFLGKDASGDPLIVDLASLPHMLIAGTTGSGKSVCMNAILMGFLYTQKPSDLKLVLVDPKMVELSQFRDIPHLLCPVVTEMAKAASILEWAVHKMDERYELLAEAGCRDIVAYNNLDWEELKERMNPKNELQEAKIPRKLPYMVFVIDELADLMMTNKEVETSIVRIAQKARAVGIHLILATQRPQANVVTGLIKSNMPGRVSFRVASGMDSRIVLDQKGGELLLGHGDMLMLTPRSSATIRAQGTLVDDAEIRSVVRFIKQHSTATFDRQIMQLGSEQRQAVENAEQRFLESAQEDPLFDRAVEMVIESGRGSVSLLQRRLAIGYTRSSRLIEMMGEAGILGGHKGTVARDVIMTIEEWQAIKEQALKDAGEDVANQIRANSAAALQKAMHDSEAGEPEPGTLFGVAEDDESPAGEVAVESKPAAKPKAGTPATDIDDAPFDADTLKRSGVEHYIESETDEDPENSASDGDDEVALADEVELDEADLDEYAEVEDEEAKDDEDSDEDPEAEDGEEWEWEYEYEEEGVEDAVDDEDNTDEEADDSNSRRAR